MLFSNKHKMLNNSHSKVTEREQISIFTTRGRRTWMQNTSTEYVLYSPSVADRWQKREMMTNCFHSWGEEAFNNNECVKTASILVYCPDKPPTALNTDSEHKHANTVTWNHHRQLCISDIAFSKRSIQGDFRTNPYVYLLLSMLDRWAD